MATLVLGGVGSALGGSVGGLLGTMVGQSIDANVFGGGGRTARLRDLSFQTSTYGTAIPRVYGTMRVAGSVIWATDLKASPASDGSPAPIYSANFAIAVSSRPALRIGRIWADGKLLRGAAGDFKVATKFRFHRGLADQPVDPLIAAVEGIGNTPAYRGIAVAVFEGLQLAEFGNRVPTLTFEVTADEGPVTTGAILTDASGGVIDADEADELSGFAACGATLGETLQPLLEARDIQLAPNGRALRTANRGVCSIVSEQEMGCGSEAAAPRALIVRKPVAELPGTIAVQYFDPARDYQAGEQEACWSTDRRPFERLLLPAALSAEAARSLALQQLSSAWARRETAEFRLPLGLAGTRVGDRLSTAQGQWLVRSLSIQDMIVIAECSRVPGEERPKIPAEAGRVLVVEDRPLQAIELAMLDLPALNEAASEPRVSLVASGGSLPSKPVAVSIEFEGERIARFSVAHIGVVGRSINRLDAGSGLLVDEENELLVQVGVDDWLLSCSRGELINGTNLASLGSELIQFATAVPLGAGQFRLKQLLRGRYGTEWAISSHVAGERFALINRQQLTAANIPRHLIGTVLSGVAEDLNGGEQDSQSDCLFQAESLRPPSPCHLKAWITGEGLAVSWVRRSRQGFVWEDRIDVPLSEERELYFLAVEGGSGKIEREVFEPHCALTTLELAAVGSGPLTIEVVQVGTFAASRPATLIIGVQ